MKINGIAHIQLTVNDLEKCMPFYEQLLVNFFEMTVIWKNARGFYCVGCRTGIAISRSDPEHRNEQFIQRRIGLHHLCFRATSREVIDELYEFLQQNNHKVVHPPEEGPWASGYYSILFEDPEGIRLEVNYIPGKGNLDPSVKLPLEKFPGYEDYHDS